MNLYLYLHRAISPNHSSRQTKAIIYQLMKHYWLQNTRYSDCVKYTLLLYCRRLARGHLPDDVLPYFKQAHQRLQPQANQPPQQEEEEEEASTLDPNNLFPKEECPSYLHFIYDKHDIQARVIQQLHSQHCSSFQKKVGLLPPTVCYARPKNIGDLATKAIVHEPPGKPASYFMGEH